MKVREEKKAKKLVRVIFYLSFKAASPSACVWFVLLEAGGCGPLSRVLSGKFLWTYRSVSKRKDGQGGIAAAADVEGHICGRTGKGRSEVSLTTVIPKYSGLYCNVSAETRVV